MPAVSSVPPSQVSAFSFYSTQNMKKKLSVPMKKQKNKKGMKSSTLSKAIQSMASPTAAALISQAKVPILAAPDLAKQFKNGKAPKLKKNKTVAKTDSQSTISIIKDAKCKEIDHQKMIKNGGDSSMSTEVKSNSHKLKKMNTSGSSSTDTSNIQDDIHGVKKCPPSKKTLKKSRAPSVPEAARKELAPKKFKCDAREVSMEKPKKLKSSNKFDRAPVMRLLEQINDTGDSKKCGLDVLKYLLAPHDPKEFFKSYWESKPLLIQREKSAYFDGFFSTEVFDTILREKYVEYTKNLDVTSYSDGTRQTHNPSGRVYPSVVWDYFSNGCSLRMLNPQTFHEPVWRILAALQEYMGSFCGANMYLTPAGTQGFAPHWDDIEAFILQLEGKKRWRVYKPRNVQEVLPRFSSPNLTQEEIGSPIIDVVLNSGDILYFPRGFIHQAEAVEETHSLHITISMYQKNAWVDLFDKIFSASSLNEIATKNVSIRKGLPLGCLDYMGSTAASAASGPKKTKNLSIVEKRKKFREQVTSLVSSILIDEVIDRAMDEMGREFVRVALPPYLSPDDQNCTVAKDGEQWKAGKVQGRVEVEPETRIKLLGAMTIRCVRGEAGDQSEYRVYHSVENSREYEGREEQFVVVDILHLPAVQHLILSYPEYTAVEDLPLPTLEDKLTVAMSLWEQNLVMTDFPLIPIDEESSDSDN